MEKRLLLAFVLSAVIFAVWSVLFPPPTPPAARPPALREVEPESPTTRPAETTPEAAEVGERLPAEAVAGEVDTQVVLRNRSFDVGISSRGAAVTSLVLHGYQGDEGQALDLVQTVDHPRRLLPLQLLLDDAVDDRLYKVEQLGRWVELRWADGAGNGVTKRLTMPAEGYGLEVEMILEGELGRAQVAVGTGLRDLGPRERDNRLAIWGDGVLFANGEIERFKRGRVKEARTYEPRTVAFVGLQDSHFLKVLRPQSELREIRVEPLAVQRISPDGSVEEDRVLQILVSPHGGVLRGQLLGSPKQYRLLKDLGSGLEQTLDFGIFAPISVLFLKALWWIYGKVGNYGLSIILLTLGIRIVLFPLMHISTVSMRKMARLQPKVKEIQARYKKRKTDPKARADMNQEMMALYKVEGVNPMSGCLPLLVQLPILWALYQLFLQAIELRHAPFILWIDDLSARDPYYITPILMTATMWLQQRLAPQVGDPQQQRIMRLMPLIFGIMFLQFPAGLVLYWLANNVITIIQQEVTLHMIGERKGRGRQGAGGAS